MKPVRLFDDPFRGGHHKIALCETYNDTNMTIPNKTNFRHFAKKIFDAKLEELPWFGLEQEFTLMTLDSGKPWPLGFPQGGYPKPQGQYYCSVGGENTFGRDFSEEHLHHCLTSKLDISGTNSEVMAGQWEYQIGPAIGIDAADQLW